MANTNYIILIQQADTGISVSAPMPDSFAFDVGATYETPLPQGLTDNKAINIGASMLGTRLAVQAMSAQLWAGNTDTELSVEVQFHTETDPVADVRTPIVNLLKLTMPSINPTTGFLTSPGPSFNLSMLSQVAGDALGNIGGAVGGIGTSVVNTVKNLVNPTAGGTPTIASLTNTSTQTNNGANNTVAQPTTQNPQLGTAAYWNTMIKNKITIMVGNYLYFDSVVVTKVAITAASNFDAQTGLPHHARVMIQFKPLFMLTQSDLDTLFVNPSSSSGTTYIQQNNYGFSMPSSSSSTPGGNAFGVGSNSYGFSL
jgi:hypothetical protein